MDRISDVEKNIKPTDLTSVLQSIANVREEMASLDIPDEVDLSPVNKSIKELEEKIAELKQEVAIVSKENELQDVLIKEIKTKANNPLAN